MQRRILSHLIQVQMAFWEFSDTGIAGVLWPRQSLALQRGGTPRTPPKGA